MNAQDIFVGFVGVPPGTTTVRLGDGRTVALADYVDGFISAVSEFASGDTDSLDPFANGRGQTVPGGSRNSNKVDNNSPRPGGMGLPNAWEMFFYAMCVSFERATAAATFAGYSEPVRLATAFDLNRKLHCEYKYGGTTYLEGQPVDFPQGQGLHIQSTQTAVEVTGTGSPDPRARMAMAIPVHEKENIGYSCTMTPLSALTISQTAQLDTSQATATIVDVKVKKYGILRRNVGSGS